MSWGLIDRMIYICSYFNINLYLYILYMYTYHVSFIISFAEIVRKEKKNNSYFSLFIFHFSSSKGVKTFKEMNSIWVSVVR